MHRQACLGIYPRIYVLQHYHQFKANLTKINVSGKIIQTKPFQYNSTIDDGSDKFALSYESFAATEYTECNLAVMQASLNKLYHLSCKIHLILSYDMILRCSEVTSVCSRLSLLTCLSQNMTITTILMSIHRFTYKLMVRAV